MAALSGEDTVATLLRALPPEVAESILARLSPEAAAKARARLEQLRAAPTPPEKLESAMSGYFAAMNASKEEQTVTPAEPANDVPEAEPLQAALMDDESLRLQLEDQMRNLAKLPLDIFARALSDEPIQTVATVLGAASPEFAADVLKKLPAERRPEIIVRLSKPMAKDPELIVKIASAVVTKARKLASLPQEPSLDDRLNILVKMLRALPRSERGNVFSALEQSDPQLSEKAKDMLYTIDDMLRVDDRSLQSVLIELDVPTLATALSGTSEELQAKVRKNMSSRAQATLAEEISLLGSVPTSKIAEARKIVVLTLRKLEDEGKISIEL
jgi:flagellar motor switch protein FliG